MTSGQLIRQARLTAGLSQSELAGRVRLPRQQIVRWEGEGVEPGFSTLRKVLRACGFDLPVSLMRYEPDPERERVLDDLLGKSPERRLRGFVERLEDEG
ncbi:MAG: helix-turn-helix transcriptional regulator [Actinobacteria bacterium]|nr:helix-turn-helix transcriptional regulator [Actinomycetota bacterium]